MYCAGLDRDVWLERSRRMWDYLLNVEGYCLVKIYSFVGFFASLSCIQVLHGGVVDRG